MNCIIIIIIIIIIITWGSVWRAKICALTKDLEETL